MALVKRIYEFADLEEHPLSTAPSLDIPSLKVRRFFMPKDGGRYMLFTATVDGSVLADIEYCPICGVHKPGFKRSGTGAPRIVHDVPRDLYRIDIAIRPQRVECADCHSKFTPTIPGIVEGRQLTERLYDYLREESFVQPFTSLSELTGISRETIAQVMDEETARYKKYREDNPFEAPDVLGIDETHIGKIMRGVLVNVRTGQLLDMLTDNKPDTMQEGIKRLSGWDTNIKVVTVDMSNSYISWLQAFLPDATIVIDPFHVLKGINDRITKSRLRIYQYLKDKISKEPDAKVRVGKKAILNIVGSDKRLFNYSTDTIRKDTARGGELAAKIVTVINEFDEYKLLHDFHTTIEHMYTMKTRKEAEEVLAEWKKILPPHGKKAYKEWCADRDLPENLFEPWCSFNGSAYKKFEPFILNYFNPGCRFANAATEGINRVIKKINSDGSGYSFERLRAKALYASLIYERKVYTVDVKTIKATPSLFENMTLSQLSKLFAGARTIPYNTFSFGERSMAGPPDTIDGFNSYFAELSPKKREDREYAWLNNMKLKQDVADILTKDSEEAEWEDAVKRRKEEKH